MIAAKDAIVGKLHGLNRFRIICDSPDELIFLNAKRKFTDDEWRCIDDEWDRLKEKNENLYSLPLSAVLMEEMVVNENDVRVPVYSTEFKNYLTTKESDNRVWALGVSALILVDNGGEKYFVFGKRKSGNLNIGGEIESVGSGFAEPFCTPEDSLLREVEEESGIGLNKISCVENLHIGFIRESPTIKYQDVCCDYLVMVEDVKRGDIKLTEHAELIVVDYDDLLDFTAVNLQSMTYRTIFTLEKYIRDCYE